jgi:hypothetical protein
VSQDSTAAKPVVGQPDARVARGLTPNELARLLRISPDRVRAFIVAGTLGAINVASTHCAKPRYVVLPHHLAEFERSRQAATPKPPPRRRKKTLEIDFYPD